MDPKNTNANGEKDGAVDLPIYDEIGDYVPNLKKDDKRYLHLKQIEFHQLVLICIFLPNIVFHTFLFFKT